MYYFHVFQLSLIIAQTRHYPVHASILKYYKSSVFMSSPSPCKFIMFSLFLVHFILRRDDRDDGNLRKVGETDSFESFWGRTQHIIQHYIPKHGVNNPYFQI